METGDIVADCFEIPEWNLVGRCHLHRSGVSKEFRFPSGPRPSNKSVVCPPAGFVPVNFLRDRDLSGSSPRSASIAFT